MRIAGYLGSVFGSVATMVGLNYAALGSEVNYIPVLVVSTVVGLTLGGYSDLLHRGLVSRASTCAAMNAALMMVVYLFIGGMDYVVQNDVPVYEFTTALFSMGVVGAASGWLFTRLAGAPSTRYPLNREENKRSTIGYFAGIFGGATASVIFAEIASSVGYQTMGYDATTTIIVSGTVGTLFTAIAGLPRLIKARWFSSYLSDAGLTILAAFSIWVAECVFMPGTNAGMDLVHGGAIVLIGLMIGTGMWGSRKLTMAA